MSGQRVLWVVEFKSRTSGEWVPSCSGAYIEEAAARESMNYAAGAIGAPEYRLVKYTAEDPA